MNSQLDTVLILGVLGQFVIVFGWMVSYGLDLRKDRSMAALGSSIKHLEAQLELLYGPLAFLLIEGEQEFKDLLDSLGRDFVFPPTDILPQGELETWLFWAENRFLPRNEKIKKLLMKHTHLIVGGTLPDSYRIFLDHANSWKLAHERWQKQQVPYSFHSKINWPTEFEQEVLNTFQVLKAQHETLLATQLPKLFGLRAT